jgi:hypothetical protein
MKRKRFTEEQMIGLLGQVTKPRQPNPEGCELKKVVGPKLKRETARYVRSKYQITTSRTCRVLGLARSTFDYDEHPRDDSVDGDTTVI